MNIINWAKDNWKILLDFMQDVSIELHLKKKSTLQTEKIITVKNSFFVFIILIIIGLIYIKIGL